MVITLGFQPGNARFDSGMGHYSPAETSAMRRVLVKSAKYWDRVKFSGFPIDSLPITCIMRE